MICQHAFEPRHTVAEILKENEEMNIVFLLSSIACFVLMREKISPLETAERRFLIHLQVCVNQFVRLFLGEN